MPKESNPLTWKQLLQEILKMDASQLNDNASVYVNHNDEFYPVHKFRITNSKLHDCPAAGILDEGHGYIVTGEHNE